MSNHYNIHISFADQEAIELFKQTLVMIHVDIPVCSQPTMSYEDGSERYKNLIHTQEFNLIHTQKFNAFM